MCTIDYRLDRRIAESIERLFTNTFNVVLCSLHRHQHDRRFDYVGFSEWLKFVFSTTREDGERKIQEERKEERGKKEKRGRGYGRECLRFVIT